jgi:cytidylate kinase
MTASVVTFSTQVGSGGNAISRAVAGRLGYRFYDWEIISQAAQEAGVSPEVLAVATSERRPSFIERVIGRLAGFDAEDETSTAGVSTAPGLLGSEDYRQFIEHVVKELGHQGEAVIVNRAGQVLLKGVPGVFRVLVYGSPEQRAQRFSANQGRDIDEVRRMLADSDRQRGEYLKRVYHIDWLSSINYDIAINTDRVGHDLAVDMIVTAAREVP